MSSGSAEPDSSAAAAGTTPAGLMESLLHVLRSHPCAPRRLRPGARDRDHAECPVELPDADHERAGIPSGDDGGRPSGGDRYPCLVEAAGPMSAGDPEFHYRFGFGVDLFIAGVQAMAARH